RSPPTWSRSWINCPRLVPVSNDCFPDRSNSIRSARRLHAGLGPRTERILGEDRLEREPDVMRDVPGDVAAQDDFFPLDDRIRRLTQGRVERHDRSRQVEPEFRLEIRCRLL